MTQILLELLPIRVSALPRSCAPRLSFYRRVYIWSELQNSLWSGYDQDQLHQLAIGQTSIDQVFQPSLLLEPTC